MRALLSDRRVRLLYIGNTVSIFGTSALSLALGIWVRMLTGSTALTGACFLALVIGTMLSPATGVLVDRFRRKPLMIWTYLATAALLLLLLFVHSREQVWLVFVVTFVYGVSGTITASAQQALVQQIVPEELFAAANGLQQTVTQGLRLVTPLVGAGVLAWLGGHAVAMLDACTFLIALFCLLRIRLEEDKPTRQAERRWAADVATGFVYLAKTPVLRQVVAASAVLVLAIGFFETVDLQIVTVGLHHAPTWLSVLLTVQGVGSVLGGVTAHSVARRFGIGMLVVSGMVLMLAMCVLFIAPSEILVLIGAASGGLALTWMVVGVMTILQQNTPNESMGRVMGAAELALAAPQSIGIGLAAMLVDFVHYRYLCIAAAVAIAAGAVYLGTRAEQRKSHSTSTPAAGSGEPEPSEQAL
ncbi:MULTISPECIES: MFS transporter [unclassified Streptomyces]|uniref:MFS transporter n=1 Tax=unclassified Streptomyces TaxID=2593676 RepID=UPI003823ACE2